MMVNPLNPANQGVPAASEPTAGASRMSDANAVALIELTGVSLQRGFHSLVQALDLSVQAGQVWCILGENGAGKSSLLAGMVDYLPVDAGQIRLGGKLLQQLPQQARARWVAWLPQYEPDTLSVTVLERVMLARHPFVDSFFRDETADIEIAEHALADVGLAGYEHRSVRQMSGGERRRVAIAACLAQQTPLLLLDEPLAALDIRHQQLLVQRFRALAHNGAGVVWITHDPNQALAGSTHVLLLMGDGQWVAGSVATVLTAANLSQAYRTDVREMDVDGNRFFYIPPPPDARRPLVSREEGAPREGTKEVRSVSASGSAGAAGGSSRDGGPA